MKLIIALATFALLATAIPAKAGPYGKICSTKCYANGTCETYCY